MLKMLFIGSSSIVEEHIKTAVYLKFKLYSLNSTKKNSENQNKIYKKYFFENKFVNWKEAIKKAGNKKNIVFLIAARVSDSEKILKFCSQYNNKIFIEKPITFKNKKIFVKNFKNVFVGYNRLYFNTLNEIEKYNLKNFQCDVRMTYNNFTDIKNNISHIMSLLFYLFGDLKLIKKMNNKINKVIIFKDKKNNLILLNLTKTKADNYSINIITNELNLLLKPLEVLNIYKSVFFKFFSNNPKKMFVQQKLSKKLNEFNFNKFKPGFLEQMKTFKKFCKKKNFKIYNDLNFANKIIRVCHKIIS